MYKSILIVGGVALLAACNPPPAPLLCDREAIEWDKWGTPDIPPECQPPNTPTKSDLGRSMEIKTPDENPPDTPDNPPDEPDTPSDPDEPSPDKVKGNNGFGNGDQDAPGNSLDNNNAENDKGGRSQRNHGVANQ